MRFRRFQTMILVLTLVFGLQAMAQDEKEDSDEKKELKFAGTPYVYTGPDTGFGVGFAIMYRDIFGKEGRDTNFSFSYTESLYQVYGIGWTEPHFLSENGRLKIDLSYETKPAVRFFGIGNDNDIDDVTNYTWGMINVQPGYNYRVPEKTPLGYIDLETRVNYRVVKAEDGENADDLEGDYSRVVSEVFPDLYNAPDSVWGNETELVGVGATFILDNRKDRFPLGGGRTEIVWPMKGTYFSIGYDHFDESLGSDIDYNKVTTEGRLFLPLLSEDTIVATRVKYIVTQGDTPFFDMPGFGGGNDMRGFNGGRFIDNNSAQLNVELRQGLFPNKIWPVFDGLIKIKYPSLFLFYDYGRVYEDDDDIADEEFDDFHSAYGGGLRIVITPSVVIRFELGFSEEQTGELYVNAGLPF
jgi:outer membrane protein assembly factor BamA